MQTTAQKRILEEWELDSTINQNDLPGTLSKVPSLHSKYLDYYSSNNNALRIAKDELEALRHLKRLYYENKLPQDKLKDLGWPFDPFYGTKKPLKGEVGNWIEADSDFQLKRREVDGLETTKEMLKEILSQIHWRSQSIRTMLDARKFEAGF